MSYFVDTNVWLYAFIEQDESKRKQAKALIQKKEEELGEIPVLSTQVINEVCVNMLRKTAFSESDTAQLVESFYQNYRVVNLNKETIIRASLLRLNYSFSFWDSMMVASALVHEISLLYSEDMHHGLVIDDKLTIENPFV